MTVVRILRRTTAEERAVVSRANGRKNAVIFTFVLMLAVVFIVCLGLGRFSVPALQALRIMASRLTPLNLEATWSDKMESVILSVRLPRLVGAVLVGAALALSGATYQSLFKNPLVSPDLLGISSGACVGAAFAILLDFPYPLIQLSALGMGLFTVFLTTLIPKLFRNKSSLMLVLSGVIMSGFMSAILGIAKYVADPEDHLASIVYWMMGAFSNARLKNVLLVSPPMLVSMTVLLLLRWRINLLSLGDAEAKSLGVNVKRARALTILCSTVLTACAVCLCGTIGWLGLIVPHLGRLVIGQDNRHLLPMSAVLGALFLVIVDTLARNLTGSEIPLSIITGALGAPLFVWLLGRQKARIGDG